MSVNGCLKDSSTTIEENHSPARQIRGSASRLSGRRAVSEEPGGDRLLASAAIENAAPATSDAEAPRSERLAGACPRPRPPSVTFVAGGATTQTSLG
ncbi:hypothetical protein CB1_001221018 [Camelus ferus]|nr:hypothetical protein CB1_001221018 [Camelus ferus]